jgi:hypothetical protein
MSTPDKTIRGCVVEEMPRIAIESLLLLLDCEIIGYPEHGDALRAEQATLRHELQRREARGGGSDD